jgi:hypothetical protein
MLSTLVVAFAKQQRLQMSKRFTETEKWRDSWFCDLTTNEKLGYIYILDNCDSTGVWDANTKLAEFSIGAKLKWNDLAEKMGHRVFKLKDGKWLVTRFIGFQYGKLTPDCRPHLPILRLVEKHKASGFPSDLQSLINTLCNRVSNRVSDTAQDKEQDKDQEQDQEKDQEQELELEAEKQAASDSSAITPEQIYSAYPRRTKRPDALRAIEKALLDSDMTAEVLLRITQSYAKATNQWPSDQRKFIPYPASWFNGERYRDDPKEWEENAIPESEKSEYNKDNAW